MLRIATRASALARWQAEEVARLLRSASPGLDVELVLTSTVGDQRTDVPIEALGGQGVFVKEVQAAVLDGRADLAVHSAKDLPSSPDVLTPGLTIGAVPPRADPRDCLVGTSLRDLGPGAPVATGSVRRRAQLAWLRPDLTFVGLRGNIATRLSRLPAGGAVLVARAALDRLELADRVAETLDPAVLLPQVGQGAMAVECRADDPDVLAHVAAIDHRPSRLCLEAERAWLAQLGGGCDLPVGAHAVLDGDDLVLDALIAAVDGHQVLRDRMTGPAAAAPAWAPILAARLLEAAGDLLP